MQENAKAKIKSLIEQRVILAYKNRTSEKLATIAEFLGKPIIATSVFHNYLQDAWELPDGHIYDQSEVYEAEEWDESQLGWLFDGLKFGINLNIKSIVYENKVVELKATYNGYLVFAEIEREIKAYAPFPVWEESVDMFYEGALIQEDKRRKRDSEIQRDDMKKRFANFWKSFKMLWGY